MTGLFLESVGSLLESVAASLMQWFAASIRWVWNTFNTHLVITSVLAISVLANLMFSSRDASAWWSERSAGKYMARLGVGPNLVMSKAVYVRDLDDAFNKGTWGFDDSRNRWQVPFYFSRDRRRRVALLTHKCPVVIRFWHS